jgi:hypothetical protein
VPHLEIDLRHGLAGVDVDDLIVEDNTNALLLLDDILSDVLATDIYPEALLATMGREWTDMVLDIQ